MSAKIKIADFRKAYDGLDWARDWNQGGTTAENLRCNLVDQLGPRMAVLLDMVARIGPKFAKDIQDAKEALGRAEAAILRNAIGRATLFQVLGSEEIPAGQYLEAERVDVVGIRKFVDTLTPEQISGHATGLGNFERFILPAAKDNCIPFLGK